MYHEEHEDQQKPPKIIGLSTDKAYCSALYFYFKFSRLKRLASASNYRSPPPQFAPQLMSNYIRIEIGINALNREFELQKVRSKG